MVPLRLELGVPAIHGDVKTTDILLNERLEAMMGYLKGMMTLLRRHMRLPNPEYVLINLTQNICRLLLNTPH